MRKPRIRWTKRCGFTEGTINKEIAFSIQGCFLQDVRESRASTIPLRPKTYKAGSYDEAKQIAFDLLNGLNESVHEANRQARIKEDEKFVELMKSSEELLASLKK